VPRLRSDTVGAARHALAWSHCRLGCIHQPAHTYGVCVSPGRASGPARYCSPAASSR
jgi:hypothetical protein